jgi:alpha-mannosidase
LKRLVLFALLMVVALPNAHAQQRTLWQIGSFDGSSVEFADSHGVDYASPASDVNYVVGQSKAGGWLRFQPGPANGLAGARLHPFRIHFNLTEAPRGTYALRIAILYETPRLSRLAIDINGHHGEVSFAPVLDYTAGDWEGTFVPQTSRSERTVPIAPEWLRGGENTITLTALDSPAQPQSSLGDIAPGVSGIVYDALALTQDAGVRYDAGRVALHAEATVLFTGTETALREVVRACAEANGGTAPPVSIALSSRNFNESKPLPFGANQFGDQCVEFKVPEWTGALDAELSAGRERVLVKLEAQKKWTVLVVPHEHLDVGFTDYRAKVAELQSQSIDGVLDLLPEHPQFRWTMDGSWVAQQYLAARSPERSEAFLAVVRAGKIVVPPQYANLHTGVASLEGLARSLYYSEGLKRAYNLPLGAANITDVPSYSWSYASVLHDAGIRYLAAGSNSWRAPIMLLGRWNEKSPFYWEGPDGGRVLMWYSRAYLQLASMFGVPPSVEAVRDALPVFLQAYERPQYRGSSVIIFGSQLENTALDRGQVTLPTEWAKLYTYPRLEFSTFGSAMQRIEHEFNGEIPVYRGDFGPYWEDGFTSDARATAEHRANQQRLLNAEVMSTIPSLLNPALRPDDGLLKGAWQNTTLFDEHTWSAVSATSTPEGDENLRQEREKRMQAKRAGDDIEYSVERSQAQMESFLAPKSDSIFIFNALAWPRGGWLEADLPEGKEILDPRTGKSVPQYALRVEKGTPLPGFGGRTMRVRYRVDGVPAVGYKLLPIVDAPMHVQPTETAVLAGNVIENSYYRITLDEASGAIRSIWDKEVGRELVDGQSSYRFGEYLYVTGADDMPNNSLYRYGATLPLPTLAVHPAASGRIVGIKRLPGLMQAILQSSAPNTPSIETTITLPDDTKRIEIAIALTKERTLRREAAYIAFPFAAEKPQFAYDTQNGWVNPERDELAGGSREWYAVQHWAAVESKRGSAAIISVDAPMATFGDIVRGAWPTAFAPKTATIFSWLMSNYWSTNFIAQQGGDFTFRYIITSAPTFDAAALTRLGWETMTPLESDQVPASLIKHGENEAGLLTLDNENVALSTWKRAEDGNGAILRLLEIAGKDETVHVRSQHLRVVSAEKCSIVEECSEKLPVTDDGISLALHPYEILTIRMQTKLAGEQ